MAPLTETLNAYLAERTDREAEAEIVDAVSAASASELNEALTSIDTAHLMDSVDNRLLGPDHRDELVRVLTQQRGDELSVHAAAALIGGMQRGQTDDVQEQGIVALLTRFTGNELTHLKNTINLAKGRHDLQGLVFNDIDDDARREEILRHFAGSSSLNGEREAKVLSDIDDTAISKIHEKRYPKGIVIPGVLAFYEALDLGPHNEPLSRGDLTFVTARPSDALGLMKGQSRRTLTEAGVTDLSIMTGSWFNIATHDAMASKKLENISHYARLYPEYDLVFIGDSGQGDVVVGEKMVETYSDVAKAVFIHDVVNTDEAERQRLAAKGVWVVDTYVGAAVKAHELGLISSESLRNVVDETSRLLDQVAWEGEVEGAPQESFTRALHERDVALAEETLAGAR